MGDGWGPAPGPIVTTQLQGLGETALKHVLRLTVEAGCEAVTSNLNPTISDGAWSGAALDIVVKQETTMWVEGLATRSSPHPQLHTSRGRHEAGPTLEVATQRHEGQPLLPDLHLVLALAPGVPQGQVNHVQLNLLPEVSHNVPDALPASEVIPGIARAGNVTLATDADPTSAVGEDTSLTAVAYVSPASAPALGLGEVSDHVEGAGPAPDSGALPDHGQQNVPVVVELPHLHHRAPRRVQDVAVASVRGEGGLVDHNHLALLTLEVELGLAARGEPLEVACIGEAEEKRQTDN